MDDAVRDYIEAIDPAYRPLFDRVHRLVEQLHPDVTVTLSYKMPTYRVGRNRLHVGVWAHGISLYGWDKERAREFTTRRPGLRTSTGTIRLRPEDGGDLSDDELRILIDAALGD